MDYYSEYADYDPKDDKVGWAESSSYALGLSASQDMPLISNILSTEAEDGMRSNVARLMGEGKMDENIVDRYGDDYAGLLFSYKDDPEVMGQLGTMEEYNARVKAEYDQESLEGEDIRSRSTGVGKFAYDASRLIAPALDPVYWPGYVTGVGMGAKVSWMVGMASMAAMETAMEVPAQIMMKSTRDRMGVAYDGTDQFINGAINVGAATAIGTVGIGIGKFVGQVKANRLLKRAEKIGLDRQIEPDIKLAEDLAEINPDMDTKAAFNKHTGDQKARQENSVPRPEGAEDVKLNTEEQALQAAKDRVPKRAAPEGEVSVVAQKPAAKEPVSKKGKKKAAKKAAQERAVAADTTPEPDWEGYPAENREELKKSWEDGQRIQKKADDCLMGGK